MKFLLSITLLIVTCSGCSNRTTTVWDDSKSLGRHVARKGKLLWQGKVESRAVASDGDLVGPVEEEFIPLRNEDLTLLVSDGAIAQPKESPGSPKSSIPGITSFKSPSAALASIFRTLHFNTDEHTVRTKEDFATLERVARYLKDHPSTYIFVTGHCDERASESYNLALGTRRANSVRALLVKRGAKAKQIFTVSYGKERPLSLGHDKLAWSQNRRAEFILYEKR